MLNDGTTFEVVDLPGAYSLDPGSPDQQITADILLGRRPDEETPTALICVVDATNLRVHLRFVLEVQRLGIPLIIALNMIDLAERDGTKIDVARLSAELGVPVIPTVAVRRRRARRIARAPARCAGQCRAARQSRGL